MDLVKWFILGLIWELIVAADIILTAGGWFAAGATSFVLSVMSFTLYKRIANHEKFAPILAISLGSALGTIISIWILK